MNESLSSRLDALSVVVPGRRLATTDPRDPVRIPAAGSHKQTDVKLVREGEWIRAIDVTCTCGETIRILCDYDVE